VDLVSSKEGGRAPLSGNRFLKRSRLLAPDFSCWRGRPIKTPEEITAQLEAERQRSRSTWDAVAPAWYARREELWKSTRLVSEWMIRSLDPRPGDTVLELAAGLGDTGFRAARLVGEPGRVIITDFAPEMVAAARRRAEEVGVKNAQFQTLAAERMD
jgi:cyclopropane fatty-acyl-phospholipid synthase-like methyltransferase